MGAVVVLYNPDSDIYEKLKQYSSFVDVVAVYDNTPSMNHSDEIRFKCKKDEIENIFDRFYFSIYAYQKVLLEKEYGLSCKLFKLLRKS